MSIMSEITITGWDTKDVRFPTSLDKTGSDAMNTAGDYSAAYCILNTDSKYSGHGMVPLLPHCPFRTFVVTQN
jgi:L-galactonate dehydratase